jgi:hypothetical protein
MSAEKRDYLRVAVSGLKTYFNLLAEKESSSLYFNFARSSTPAGEATDQANQLQQFILSTLQRLESKIDYIIRDLQRNAFGKPYKFQADVANLGGGGLNLITDAPCSIGVLMDLCIVPEFGNAPSLYAIGRVQWMEQLEHETDTGRCKVGVEFVEINEEDREALFRTVFDLDRKQKRSMNSD